MDNKEELELLNSVKLNIIKACNTAIIVGRDLLGRQTNTFTVTSDDWHEIFKTDEYNEMKNESLSKES